MESFGWIANCFMSVAKVESGSVGFAAALEILGILGVRALGSFALADICDRWRGEGGPCLSRRGNGGMGDRTGVGASGRTPCAWEGSVRQWGRGDWAGFDVAKVVGWCAWVGPCVRRRESSGN